MELLRLVALDEEDLAVVSAHLQDAVVRVADLTFLPLERRFVLCAERLDAEQTTTTTTTTAPARKLAGLHFERVLAARTRGLDRASADKALTFLGIAFEERDPPSGTATLLFSDGVAVQLDLECVEAQMKDLGPATDRANQPSQRSGAA